MPWIHGSWFASPPPPPSETANSTDLADFMDFAIKTDQNEQKPRVVGSHGMFKACVTHTNDIYTVRQTQRR